MTALAEPFAQAQRLADAVLYEGYVLYPYRASARKNQLRWQFGVLAPRAFSEAGGGEDWWMQTECLLEPGERPALTGVLRFLHVQRRTQEDAAVPAWDEGVERAIEFAADLTPGTEQVVPFALPAGETQEPLGSGWVRRQRRALSGALRIHVERVAVPCPLSRLRVRVENLTPLDDPGAPREEALRWSLTGAHLLLAARDAAFVSATDPPEWARLASAACVNFHTWPVLVGAKGERGVVLASPIILADHPQIAPESAGDLYDATEIDEILTLRILTLTEDEKREARATDLRAAALLDRVEAMSPQDLAQLHGAVRDAAASPDTDSVEVAGRAVARGSRVRLRPGARRADAHDMFFAGRVATVRGVYMDFEDQRYVAVTLDDDPGADLQEQQRRYLYFYPDEIVPVTDDAADAQP